MEWATIEGERTFLGSGRSERWGAEERRWDAVKEVFIPSWGPTAVMGGTAGLKRRHCRPVHNSRNFKLFQWLLW
jgi:hypothetical protein